MSSPIRIRDADKDRLDRLQAEITARSGRKLTQQELLTRLVTLAERRLDDLLAEVEPASPEQIERLLSLPVSTGIRTREEDIDRVLYGGSGGPA